MYIAIAGNIGSGKSTLTGLLAQRYGLLPVYETVDENPYLADFYADMGRWSFHSQVFFLAKRLRQHLEQINPARHVVQDRTIYEDAFIFAQNLRISGHLSERDWQTYLALYEGIAPALRKPDLLIYVRASVETLQAHIARRGRDYEQHIPPAYLASLNRLYEAWIGAYDLSPVLVISSDSVNYADDEEARELMYRMLEAYGLSRPLV
ncbi:deoxynucleoside kinase [Meiothermus taiwanensis]|jgi:deoxyadenosine/deoxycytidine kinase|uniref:Deoxyadenosine/deoxycytidine kinase n=2 Tax=Meiothermus taiwanensis TaxID=172827 RepID=A0A399DY44_9DEIN|nr:deoxynucleoside kinase [Meiothermus taiwanensis]AWR85800.1 deoxynucleoside kinase [Meiothermus taiwanensis WR-220]KIQ54822.1 deoxyguanosine kinase [Meiothermus taiwanensis]KZK16120.1 deoxyguanosine kinase [Meiothermus taiwanensis]RIH77125.1 Deoxyadenosine/deoxycytidine kinase [Meiothermus taiwanensis]